MTNFKFSKIRNGKVVFSVFLALSILIIVFINPRFFASEQFNLNGIDHTVTYTKEELTTKIEKSIQLGQSGESILSDYDFSHLDASAHIALGASGERLEIEGIKEWIELQLSDSLVVDIIDTDDNCTIFVGADKLTFELNAIIINSNAEKHTTKFEIKEIDSITSELSFYPLDKVSDNSDTLPLGTSLEDDIVPLEENILTNEDLSVSEEIAPLKESDSIDESFFSSVETPTTYSDSSVQRSIIGKASLETTLESTENDSVVIPVDNGIVVAKFGLKGLYTRPLPALFNSNGNILSIHGNGSTIDKHARWSGDALPYEYTLNLNSVINVIGQNLTVEFYNSIPVEISQFNGASLTQTTTISPKYNGSTFIVNTANNGGLSGAGQAAIAMGASNVITVASNNKLLIQAKSSSIDGVGFLSTGNVNIAGSNYELDTTGQGYGVSVANLYISGGSIVRGLSNPSTIVAGKIYAGINTSGRIEVTTLSELHGTVNKISKTAPAGASNYTLTQIKSSLQTFGVRGENLILTGGDNTYNKDNKSKIIAKGGDVGAYFSNVNAGNRFRIFGGAYAELDGYWAGLFTENSASYMWIGDDYTTVYANGTGFDATGSPIGYGIASTAQVHIRMENEAPLSSVYGHPGCRVFSTGTKVGVTGRYVAVYDSSVLVAKGGVDPSYQIGSDYLPLKDLDGNNILPEFKAETYGILVPIGGTYIVAYHDAKLYAYGGEYGTKTFGNYFTSYHGSRYYAYGGRVGAENTSSFADIGFSSFMEVEGRDIGLKASGIVYLRYTSDIYAPANAPAKNAYNVLRAKGKVNGIITGSNVSAGDGHSYVFADAQSQAIQGSVSITGASAVVTKTRLPAIPNDTGQTPETTPSNPSVSGNVSGSTTGLFHEIFVVENFDIKSPPPVVLNQKYNAIKKTMGAGNRQINNYVWTAPLSPPVDKNAWPANNLSDFGYLNYSSSDDQKIIKKSGYIYSDTVARVGIDITRSVKETTIIADGTSKAAPSIPGFPSTVSSSIGSVSSGSKHRVTILGAEVMDNRTMDVEIKLTEDIFDLTAYNTLLLNDLKDNLSFQLHYWPLPELDSNGNVIPNDYNTPVSTVTIDKSYGLDLNAKTIHLSKLKMGEYILAPVNQMGYPYNNYPNTAGDGILFVLKIDTSDNTGGDLKPYWIEKVFLDTSSPTLESTRMTLAAGAAGTGISTSSTVPTFPQPNPILAAMIPERYGEFRLLFSRIKHDVDFKLIDADSTNLQLDGKFTLKAYPSTTDTSKSYIFPDLTRVSGSPVIWPKITSLWAGLSYELEQTDYQKPIYIKRQGKFKFQLGDDAGDISPVNPVEGYTATTNTPFSDYSIVVTNLARGINSVPMYLLDRTQLTKQLSGGIFELHMELSNGETTTPINLADDGFGKYLLNLREGRTYHLKETTPPVGFLLRPKTYEFTISIVENGALLQLQSINYLNGSADDGWETTAISGYDGKSIYISNIPGFGDLKIDFTGKNLWEPHGKLNVLVKIEGVTPQVNGRVYWDYVQISGTNIVNDISAQSTGPIQKVYNDVPVGGYEVTIYYPGRFKTPSGNLDTVTIPAGGTASTAFVIDQSKYKLFSDQQVMEYTFIVD